MVAVHASVLARAARRSGLARCARGTAGRRWYASAPGGDGQEPVESVLQRILEPTHAQSIGVSAEKAGAKHPTQADSVRALVPLNVIYLPPPPWHTPMQPLVRRSTQPPPPSPPPTNTQAQAQAPAGGNSGRACRDTAGGESADGGVISQLARRLWPPRRAAPDPVQESVAQATAEKWKDSAVYRLLGAWRRVTGSVRAIPKDQDWVSWSGAVLNEVTGYQQIAQLRAQVDTSGSLFQAARTQLSETKARHTQTTKDRLSNQREISSLLQRKHLWSEDDVARFTSLYRTEHQSETAEQRSAAELKEAESLVDRRYDELVNAIRQRYHEEQIWSDKIRRASTYGTWAVLCMNIVALLLAQAIFEPRKRRKIVDGVDGKIAEAASGQQAALQSVGSTLDDRLARQEEIAARMAQHLYSMSLTLDTLAAPHDAGPQPPVSVQPEAIRPELLLGSDQGYSDTELDMYYAQLGQRDPARQGHQAYTRAEAGRMAAGAAAATGLVVGALMHWLSSK
ncbi:sensitivity to high expression protein she9 [Coemansia spiralis]|nr:sensitivity to high expression protein she9 [Coemansia spiralis]